MRRPRPLPMVVLMSLGLLTLGGCRNFHSVQQNALYRSAQLKPNELELAIDHLRIRTIINLRGEHPEKGWYRDEATVAANHGVRLINIAMSATRIPSRGELLALLDAYRDAERPILVHCARGADRTGEAVALYLMDQMGRSRNDALSALSSRYHHYEIAAPAMRYFISQYQGREWAYETYDPCQQDYRYFDKKKYCETAPSSPASDPTDDPEG